MRVYDWIRQYVHWTTVVDDKWETKALSVLGVKIPVKRTVNLAPILNGVFDITRCPPATGKLRKLQLVNLKLLRIFAAICEQHDIPYYLCGGTLLGAVRHRGFIPWDDDLDVSVPGEFIDVVQAVLEESLKGTNLRLWGVEDTRLSAATLRMSHKHFDSVNLDIFYPYCFATTQQDRERVYKAWAKAHFKYCCDYAEMKPTENRASILKFRKEMDEYYASLLPEMVDFFNASARYMTTELHWGHYRYIPMTDVLPFSEIEFEGFRFRSPHDPKAYTIGQYGDIYSFPPHFDHHGDEFMRFDEKDVDAIALELDELLLKFERG